MYTWTMSKCYVKDPNGKYRLVEKETQRQQEGEQEGTPEQQKEITPEARAFVREVFEGPKLKELEERIKRLESIVIDPRKK